ncbi:MAG TPA: PEP-CTERM sorting domain-containing protein, partial [Telluria sp.]|nr:PEP-CTERM sorting domain-containing protein [Telluria sp.]
VDSDGHGGFLNSTLVLDWDKIFRVSGVDFYFDFAGGADEQAFISGGLLNLDTFFKTNSVGLFSEAFDLASTFSDSRFIVAGYNISGFDPTSGRLIAVAVPEPASWMLIAMGLFTMCLTCIRRRSGYALLPDAEAAENHAQ